VTQVIYDMSLASLNMYIVWSINLQMWVLENSARRKLGPVTPDMSRARPFSPSKLPVRVCGSGPHPIHGSSRQPESASRTTSRSLLPLLQGSQSW